MRKFQLEFQMKKQDRDRYLDIKKINQVEKKK